MKTVIVKDGKSAWKIGTARGVGRRTRFAALEMRNFIERMTLAALPIVEEGRGRECLSLVEDETLPSEGFRIEVTPQRVEIRGNGNGVLYGVYAFLEKVGCRFVIPGDDCVPRGASLQVEQCRIEESPDSTWRMGRIVDPTLEADPAKDVIAQIDWCAKNRLNWIECTRGWPGVGRTYGGHPLWAGERAMREEITDAAMDRGVKLLVGSHAFLMWCPPDEFFETHPEYYSELDGERKPKQLCVTNPDVERIVAERVIQFLDDTPAVGGVHLGPQDGGNFCTCKRCMEVDSPLEYAGGNYKGMNVYKRSRSIFSFVDRVAARVAEKHPDIWITAPAYGRNHEPPSGFSPRAPNMSVRLTWYWYCSTHALTDPSCEINAHFWNVARRWVKQLGRKSPFICGEYHYGMGAWNFMPWPQMRVSAANWKAAVRMGATGGWSILYHRGDAFQYRLAAHVWARLMWNLAWADEWRELLRRACAKYLGDEAGALVTEYLLALERCAEECADHLKPHAVNVTKLLDAAQLKALCDIAERIRRAPLGPVTVQRASRLLWQHDLLDAMWHTMAKHEEAGAAAQKGETDQAKKLFAETKRFGLNAMKRFPDDPLLINKAAAAVRAAQEYLGEEILPETDVLEAKVAEKLGDKQA